MKKLLLLFFPILIWSQTNFERGEKLFKEKKLPESKPYFEAHLKQNPNDELTLEYLGDIAGQAKKWDEAIKYYKKLKEQHPKNADYWYKYGGAMGMKAKESSKFKALGMIDNIEEAFLTSAKLNPKHTDVRWALIILYLELPGILGGSEKKAQKYADDLMSFSKIDGLMANGHIHEYFKRWEKAENYYRQGVNLTHSKTAYQRLINLYKKAGWKDKQKTAELENDKMRQ